MLSELKKFKVQTILVLQYRKRNYRKIFDWIFKLIVNDSDIDEVFMSMHQSIMRKIKNYASEDWIVLDLIINNSIKLLALLIYSNFIQIKSLFLENNNIVFTLKIRLCLYRIAINYLLSPCFYTIFSTL